jgi:uncharacterized protein
MTMPLKYDAAIIGGGISGIMAAYRLRSSYPSLKIVIIEKGKALTERSCPMVVQKSSTCLNCSPCAIMEGMAGAGAFSDGKYIISTEYGGWLKDYLPEAVVMDYINQADSLLIKYGAAEDYYTPDDGLKKLCLEYDLHMQQAKLKHFGTDANYDTMKKLIDDLSGSVDIMTRTEVTDVDKEKHIIYTSKGEISAEIIIFAVGRVGSLFLSGWCKKNGIAMVNNQVDIGVRVELPAIIWNHFSEKIYEPKIWYRSKKYGDITRMFCFNERGSVVIENTGGVLTVNGHSYKDEKRKTVNSNFALLSTIKFTQPFKDPIEYARYVASLANLISGGGVLVQRLGDLEAGRRTDHARLSQSTTAPTLEAVPGDLSLCMPKRQLDNILETLHALDNVAPGTANHDTLLYGIECKYYSARPESVNFELSGCQNIYAIGDGGGFTRSLSHAAAHGLYVADYIIKSKENYSKP